LQQKGMSTPIRLFGVIPSQPYRTVLWVCQIKGLPVKYERIIPGIKTPGGGKSPDFLKINPTGTIPAIDDNGFYLYESSAILIYLSEKYNWTDIFPTDIKERARVHQYLHWHHRNVREVTVKLVAPLVRTDLNLPSGPTQFNEAKRIIQTLEDFYLSKTKFVAGDKLTIADFLCFEELVQCESEYFEVFDFSPYPGISRWLKSMKELPKYSEFHKPFAKFAETLKKSKTTTTNEPKSKLMVEMQWLLMANLI